MSPRPSLPGAAARSPLAGSPLARAALLAFSLAACADGDKVGGGAAGLVGGEDEAVDADGDGVPAGQDCDDNDAATSPEAIERCDGVDNNCDGQIDEGVTEIWFADADGDGFGDAAAATEACEAPAGAVPDDGDCDDGDAEVYPSADERCDGQDNDCDGEIDEDVRTTWYADSDGDGFGDPAAPIDDCDPGPGVVGDATDCDDRQTSVYPGAAEACDELDNDCDGAVDEGVAATWYADRDGDGYGIFGDTTEACAPPVGYAAEPGDCDDAADAIFPGAVELCNGTDDNCDGAIDEDSAADARSFWADADGDGFGDDLASTVACAAPAGFVDDNRDCDDRAAAVNPDATEVCNGLDDDCDRAIDDADSGLDRSSGATFYADADRDGYGDLGAPTQACALPSGFVLDASDCDDGNNRVSPAAAEVCNGIDDDCDAQIDDADASLDVSTGGTYYRDTDADGFGAAAAVVRACVVPAGAVTNALDCDDARPAVNPLATEVCNSRDDDCDGLTDDADPGVNLATGGTWYTDADRDGYGAAAAPLRACVQPAGSVTGATDCDDARAAVNPGATELCNGLDDDCDSRIDDADSSLSLASATAFYRDADGDSYGSAATSTRACLAPAGYVTGSADCDDTRAAVNPAATEVCNGLDDDCDSRIDDADPSLSLASATTHYRDADGDGFGSAGSTTRACTVPSGYVSTATDCDDSAAGVSPAASERCNSIDDDCDGTIDESSAIDATTYYRDADGDGYGSSLSSRACARPSGYVGTGGDCDDAAASRYPGADEVCNSADDDCDGTADESRALTNFSASPSAVMQLNGSSTVTGGYLELTPAAGGTGTAFYYDPIPGSTWEVSFTFSTGGGSGADGLALAFLASTDYTLVGVGGGGIGYTGLPGYAVEVDTYENVGIDPNGNHLAVVNAATQGNFATTTSVPTFEDTGWHSATVRYEVGRVRAWIDGTLRIDTTVSGYTASEWLIGFTAATGGSTNYHRIDDVEVGCP